MLLVPSVTWLPRNACSLKPCFVEMDDAEFAQSAAAVSADVESLKNEVDSAISRHPKNEDASDSDQMDVDTAGLNSEDEFIKRYRLDEYDNSNDDLDAEAVADQVFGNIADLAESDLELDENAKIQELEELKVLESDSILCLGCCADDLSTIEFQVCTAPQTDDSNREARILYAHHDCLLPAMPLCVEFVGYRADSSPSGFVAVSGMDPSIELWDVNVVDSVAPQIVLGGYMGQNSSDNFKPDSHTGPVITLAWNKHQPNILSSASADGFLKLWDLQTQACYKSFENYHGGKAISCSKWAHFAPACILTGGHNRRVNFGDINSPENSKMITIDIAENFGDPEAISWACAKDFTTSMFYLLCENGDVLKFDLRNISSPLFTLSAHNKGASDMSVSNCGNFLATVGADELVKVWDVSSDSPSLHHSRNVGLNRLLSCSWCPDTDGVLAVGGTGGSVVLDLARNSVLSCSNDHGSDSEVE